MDSNWKVDGPDRSASNFGQLFTSKVVSLMRHSAFYWHFCYFSQINDGPPKTGFPQPTFKIRS